MVPPSLSISMHYNSTSGTPTQTTVYANQTVEPGFAMPGQNFACSNLQNFIMNQSQEQYQDNS